MIKAIVFICIFVLLSQSLWAQPGADTIGIRRTWSGSTYYQYDGRNISYRKINRLFSADPEAAKMWRRAQAARWLGASIDLAGVICLWAYVGSPSQRTPDALGLAGIGLVAASVPFAISFRHQLKKAVNVYNRDAGGVGFNEPRVNLDLFFTGSRAGLALQF